jgi:hypothetical protein
MAQISSGLSVFDASEIGTRQEKIGLFVIFCDNLSTKIRSPIPHCREVAFMLGKVGFGILSVTPPPNESLRYKMILFTRPVDSRYFKARNGAQTSIPKDCISKWPHCSFRKAS